MSILAHYLSSADLLTVGLSAFMLLWVIALVILHAARKRRGKGYGVWRAMCLAPLMLCAVHCALRYFRGGGGLMLTAQLYGVMYIGAVIIALWQFFARRKHGHRITSALTLLLTVCFSAFTFFSALMLNMDNYSRLDYEDSFKAVILRMKENYVLTDWKEIDFDALEAELLPKVKKARSDNDPAGYMAALCELKYNMFDGHVTIEALNKDAYDEAMNRIAGDDYGFAMFTLNNGDTIAVLVDERGSAYEAGIREGAVITKWNGEDIDTAKASVKCVHPSISFPVEENERLFQAAFLAGRGGARAEVTYKNEHGDELTVELKSGGSYAERLSKLCAKLAVASEYDNFTAKLLSGDCGYLLVNSEEYSAIKDIACMFTGEYPEITELVGNKLDELKAQGMRRLIIDARNNTGGMDEISGAVAALFTDEKLYINGMGAEEGGEYRHIYKHYLNPVGAYKDMPVVVLTNYMCLSAGDGLAYDLSRCPNVTLMGITQPCGVNQFTGGCIATSDSEFLFYYPSKLSLDEDGGIFIDTRADRISRNLVDVKIPVTAEAAAIIFGDDGADYELDYALEYINGVKS